MTDRQPVEGGLAGLVSLQSHLTWCELVGHSFNLAQPDYVERDGAVLSIRFNCQRPGCLDHEWVEATIPEDDGDAGVPDRETGTRESSHAPASAPGPASPNTSDVLTGDGLVDGRTAASRSQAKRLTAQTGVEHVAVSDADTVPREFDGADLQHIDWFTELRRRADCIEHVVGTNVARLTMYQAAAAYRHADEALATAERERDEYREKRDFWKSKCACAQMGMVAPLTDENGGKG